MPLAALVALPRKPRMVDIAHVCEVVATISTLGFSVPVLVGDNNVIIDGLIRVEAAKLLGLGEAPCVRMEHLSKVEQRLPRLAANRLGEKGAWDLAELNADEIGAASAHLVDGGVYGTFIDWRGMPIIDKAAKTLGLEALNLIVWAKTNAGMGSLYRSRTSSCRSSRRATPPT